MKQNFEEGNVVTVSDFNYTNKHGGTGTSYTGEKYTKPVKVKLVRVWEDYETGANAWAVSKDKELDEYLKKHSVEKQDKKGNHSVSEIVCRAMNEFSYLVFVSEFDMVKQ